jgi:hypothetical protein
VSQLATAVVARSSFVISIFPSYDPSFPRWWVQLNRRLKVKICIYADASFLPVWRAYQGSIEPNWLRRAVAERSIISGVM